MNTKPNLTFFLLTFLLSLPFLISTHSTPRVVQASPITFTPIIKDTWVLNIRDAPEGEVIFTVSRDERMEYLGTQGSWIKVETFDGIIGFVDSFFIELIEGRTFSHNTVSSSLIEFGSQFIGTPYVWGGNSLTRGVDCSGFTKLVFASEGIGLPRTAQTQSKLGVRVEKNQLMEGDLVFFSNFFDDNMITHVGIYMSNGQFIHSGSAHGVEITSLNREWYTKHFRFGRRLIT